MMKLNAKKTGMALCALAALTVACMTGCEGSVSGEIELGGVMAMAQAAATRATKPPGWALRLWG
ncbi:MAG: hypothetical protein K2J81_07890, partial [Treponemataceae bacterium]|nr:hypothetical protein [Treponemataceae bacterium]